MQTSRDSFLEGTVMEAEDTMQERARIPGQMSIKRRVRAQCLLFKHLSSTVLIKNKLAQNLSPLKYTIQTDWTSKYRVSNKYAVA
jgi:hypothetical protein